jgi:hypothetical protein
VETVPQLLLNSKEKYEVVEEDGVISDKLRTLQRILCLQDPEHTEENKYKMFLHEVARSWISDSGMQLNAVSVS